MVVVEEVMRMGRMLWRRVGSRRISRREVEKEPKGEVKGLMGDL